MGGTILSFQLTDRENAQLKDLCTVMGLRLREVSPAQYGQTVGALAGMMAETDAPKHLAPLPEKMLVFADVADGALDVLLSMLRAMNIAAGSYKAVLTETNQSWNVPTLFAELRAERRELENR